MWIKFEITGELEKQFMAVCKEECRTSKQQGLYIVKEYVKNNYMESFESDDISCESESSNNIENDILSY